jgi:hypothetical protein
MMNISLKHVAALERINYQASRPIVEVTPGLDMVLSDEVILTSSRLLPTPDTTHACLLRATPQTADALISRVIDYFTARELPPTIFLSPACTPTDLPERLVRRGFVKNAADEAWMVGDNLRQVNLPGLSSKVTIKSISQAETLIYADTFITAFGLPIEAAPAMAGLIRPSVGLPGVFYYLGYVNDQPVSTFSLICYQDVGIIGSAGVTPSQRGQFIISNLAIKSLETAREHGANTILLQTTAGSLLERLLRIYGFKKIFIRTSYTLL